MHTSDTVVETSNFKEDFMLKKIFALAAVVMTTVAAAPNAFAAPAGCTSVVTYPAFIYKQSKPVRASSAITAPIIYFERSPSLLVNTPRIPRRPSATLIDSNGNYLTTCGIRDCRDCRQGFRYVCGYGGGTNNLARKAKSKTGNYRVYYRVNNVCAEIQDIGRCYGSVKGLCNQVLH